jgi:hypothetical protein
MKEKNLINGAELERINGELFGPFNPDDETWIVGGSWTNTAMATFSPSGPDCSFELDDWVEMEIPVSRDVSG